jgi:hypothetical protein
VLFALSRASTFKKGVSLLSTDCVKKWEVYYFSSNVQIQRIAYTDREKALSVFLHLVKTVDERQFKASKESRQPCIDEDHAQDFVGYSELSTADLNKTKALEDESMVERFADYLADIYRERPVVPSWARAEARCPDYFS